MSLAHPCPQMVLILRMPYESYFYGIHIGKNLNAIRDLHQELNCAYQI